MKIGQLRGRVSATPGDRFLVKGDVRAARTIGIVLSALTCLAVPLVYENVGPDRFGWSLALLAAVALIARGIFLGRPVTTAHAAAAAAVACVGLGAHFVSFGLIGNIFIGASGLTLMLPTSARPQPELLDRVWALVNATRGDPLAPFAMHSSKSYYFSPDEAAAIAYRTRLGFAVVSGDPIGDSAQFATLASDFARMCRSRGWRIIVLACGERHMELWPDQLIGHPRLAVPIGRDVVVEVRHFSLKGRSHRNLRQAVQRTLNCGVTTQLVNEQEIDGPLLAELTDVLYAAHRSGRTERGFCMNLDGALQGRLPGIKLAIARDRCGRVVAFHRYATAGKGSEISLDVPFRLPTAPNGVDERLSFDMIAASKDVGAERISLAFAAFPEIFDATHPGNLQRLAYRLIHLLDPMIRLESLYRYLRKYHSLGQRRYVVLCAYHIPIALAVLLSLEFVPHRYDTQPTRPGPQ
ncbi:bifunctional lysylphosphatidylglycerol flippase/synthetase MprF [Mycobacterium sp. M23085]|uniref:bifunctional lysylphosphatidylglycerol flippase/synthetase MprF n=1 Tax=Mycobacterium sp. M23085 TaxID=3378087 RepID=UPI0038782A12